MISPLVPRIAAAGKQQRATLFACAALFAGVGVLLFAFSWNSVSAGFLSDDAVYLLMADGLSPFRSMDPALKGYIFRESIFPPMYPLLLAWLGGGSGQLLWSHVITTATLVVSIVLFWRWAALESRHVMPAAALAVVYAVLPMTLLHGLELMSEFPFVMFTLAALGMCARPQTGPSALIVASLCVGLAAITRTAGMSLILAFAIWLLAQRPHRRSLLFFLAIAPTLLWQAYIKAWGYENSGGYGQFWHWLASQTASQGPAFLVAYGADQITAAWHGLLMNLDVDPGLLTQSISILLLLLALPTLYTRTRALKLDALYLLIGGAVTIVYPFPDHFTRLIMPWVPLILLYAYLTLVRVAGIIDIPLAASALRYGLIVALLLAIAPSLGFFAARWNAPVSAELASWKHTRFWYQLRTSEQTTADVASRQKLIDAIRDLRDLVPPRECLIALRTALTMLFSQHVVRLPPPPQSASAALLRTEADACPDIFAINSTANIGSTTVPAFYPKDALDPDAFDVLRTWPAQESSEPPTAILLRAKPRLAKPAAG